MTQPFEHDWPPTMKYHRKARRIETVEILPPRQSEHHVHVTVHHRHNGIRPQQVIIAAALLFVVLILLRSPGALILLAVLVPPTVWIAIGIFVAILAIAAIRERWHGRPF
jgi:hypothetical protein